MISEKMMSLGKKRSVIREIFEYGNKRRAEIGAENVFDFSLGNPSIPAPEKVREVMSKLILEKDAVALHGYTSAQGAPNVRKAISDDIKARFGINASPDSIYMTCIFLVKYGLYYKNEEAIKLALEQSKIHTQCLFCEEEDLIFHAYHCIDNENLGQHWGRGNGWFVVTLAELILHLQGTEYDIDYLKEIFVRVMNRVLSMREADGMIHTLIDVKESYKETTGSLLCCYAALIGYKCGILGKEFVEWADDLITTVIEMLDENDMNLLYCSGGTGPESKETYMATKFSDTLYANGLVIQLFAERTITD